MTLDLDLRLRRGAFELALRLSTEARVTALIGPSGSGKSTLLHAIAGIIEPSAGFLRWGDETWFERSKGINKPPHQRRIGYVFQESRLFPHLDVQGNLRFGMRYATPPRSQFAYGSVVEMLALGSLQQRSVHNLSGGERQRVAIGRALLAQPALLLLDEPLSSIDRAHADQLLPYLIRLRDDLQVPMIYVSHDPDEVSKVAQAVVQLGDQRPLFERWQKGMPD
ncbi:MAG: ATP-binding cassette domain-containing protein [Xanthomonadales bacterium]|nr:ATP-binding cassette domain-containing protein [Xanthomonadales bacterium]